MQKFYSKITNGIETGVLESLQDLELKTPSELVDEWTQAIEGDINHPLTTCMPKFDTDLRNKLRGTVGAYIGYGGTRKSLFALQALRTNVISSGSNSVGLYSNMEMAVYQMMCRIIDMSYTDDDFAYNRSWIIEKDYQKAFKEKDEKQKLAIRSKVKAYFDQMYGSNLMINSKSSMRVEDYNSLILKAKSKLSSGKIDMLVIDGLSMMSGAGTETETYTTNSKELKDLAKEHNIFIPLICHLSKGAEKTTRDTMRHIRGSEKILDNVDFVVMMSLLEDEANGGEYYRDKGYIRLFNKRGSGNTVNVIYDFDCKTLTMKESATDPKLFEQEKRKNLFQ
jgi:hypothetical protein